MSGRHELRFCRGYAFEVDGRALGTVEDVLYGDGRRPAALVVRPGLGTARLIVPADRIVAALAGARRVVSRDLAGARRLS